MSNQTTALQPPKAKRQWLSGTHSKLTLTYIFLMVLPYLVLYGLPEVPKQTYYVTLSFVNIVAMMAFFIQFPLGSRLKRIAMFANIDWSMEKHKTVGQWIGVIFLLHPVMILFPRFVFLDGWNSIVTTITAPEMLNGIIAWVVMLVWILASVFKDKLPMSYELWRFTHMLGFVVIAILATDHMTSVGNFSQLSSSFSVFSWSMCALSIAMVGYNYLIKPKLLTKSPFTLKSVNKVSTTDWEVKLEIPENVSFTFEPGQFVWFNTSGSVGNLKDHPFSIASSQSELPEVSFIIRELGDYTSQLGNLEVGQEVYVDGPYGSMSLDDSKQSVGITLIAGGCGIGPMLSLLRGLAANNDPRPIRLVYGNNREDQMILQEEINALEKSMPDFHQQLVCIETEGKGNIYQGVVDQHILNKNLKPEQVNNWSVYLCGPKPMINAVRGSLKQLGVPKSNIHFEQLSF